MSIERDMELMERGQAAAQLLSILQPVIDEGMRTKLTLLIKHYRAGKIDHDLVIGLVAELACLEEILSNFESDIRRSETAHEREHHRGQKKS